jgi:DNA-binding NarL/FixJ family response regulator
VVRVLLADDEPMIRVGVRAILATDPEMEVVAEAADGREAVALTLRHKPDIALLDIRMPRLDGLAAAEELRRVAPGTSLMMLTTFSEDEFITRALSLGVSGFVLKSGDPRELIAGVRAVSAGGAYLSPEVAHRIITHLHGGGRLDRAVKARTRLEGLTGREREVVGLVGAGLSNAEIAARLYVVEGTVKAHVSAVLTQLGLRNRVQLAILAYEAGLLDGD